jgi:hypothetical protein
VPSPTFVELLAVVKSVPETVPVFLPLQKVIVPAVFK